MRSFGELYNVHALRADMPSIIHEIKQLIAPMDPGDLQHGDVLWIDQPPVSRDWRGTYQPQDIVEAFGLDENWEDEWIWEAIEEAEWELSCQAQDTLSDILPPWLAVGFGFADHSSDYGLILWYDEGGFEELMG
jgi:hypothetical protein